MLCVVGTAAVLSGCSSGGSSEGNDANAACGDLSIGQLAELAPQNEPVFEAYESEFPCVDIVPRDVPIPNILTQLLTQRLANDLPDVIQTGGVWSNTLTTQGVQGDLSPFLNDEDFFPQDYWLENFLMQYIPNQGPDKGKVFGVPMTADATVVYYNEDAFAEAGVPLPEGTWSWSDLVDTAGKLAKFDGDQQIQWGLSARPDWEAVWNPMIEALGGCSFCEDASGFGSAEAVETFRNLLEPSKDGAFVPWDVYVADGYSASAQFAKGTAAMFIGVRAEAPGVAAGVDGKFAYNVVNMPVLDGTDIPLSGSGSLGWAISGQTKNQELALDFLKWLYSEDGGLPLVQEGGGSVPAVGSQLGSDAAWRSIDVGTANTDAYAVAAEQSVATPIAPGDAYNVAMSQIKTAIEAVVVNGESYEDAFGALAQQVDAAYDRASE
jgi:multiple sugar transport system substrate-binding protein